MKRKESVIEWREAIWNLFAKGNPADRSINAYSLFLIFLMKPFLSFLETKEKKLLKFKCLPLKSL